MTSISQTHNHRQKIDPKRIKVAIQAGLKCRSFVDSKLGAQDFESVFSLVRSFNQPNISYGFFDKVDLGNQRYPVMGSIADELFDVSKSLSRNLLVKQLREFVLKYFLRVSDFRAPESFVNPNRITPSRLIDPFCFCQKQRNFKEGFGYSLILKKQTNGFNEKVEGNEKFKIPDLRTVGPQLDWILLNVRLFDFNVNYRPFGGGAPSVRIPLDEESKVVMSPEFVTDSHKGIKGGEAEFGFGYAIFPPEKQTGFLAYGPGQFDFGYSEFRFRVTSSGEVRLLRTFLVNRPQKILDVPLNPIAFAKRVVAPYFDQIPTGPELSTAPILTMIDLLNCGSFGFAEKICCISREQIEKNMLLQHFLQNYEMISGAQNTWRRVKDWTDESQIPDWALSGISS